MEGTLEPRSTAAPSPPPDLYFMLSEEVILAHACSHAYTVDYSVEVNCKGRSWIDNPSANAAVNYHMHANVFGVCMGRYVYMDMYRYLVLLYLSLCVCFDTGICMSVYIYIYMQVHVYA